MIKHYCDKCKKEGEVVKTYFGETPVFVPYTGTRRKSVRIDLCEPCFDKVVEEITGITTEKPRIIIKICRNCLLSVGAKEEVFDGVQSVMGECCVCEKHTRCIEKDRTQFRT
jgi:hypothetical protein